MKEVCSDCHTPSYVDNFYKQYDGVIELYNEKFAKPGSDAHGALARARADHPDRSSTKRSSGPGSSSGTTRAGGRATAPR